MTDVSVANGRIYAGSTSLFYAFDATGAFDHPDYIKSIGDTIRSTPALNSGQVFFGNEFRSSVWSACI